jgi:hypothetical protein
MLRSCSIIYMVLVLSTCVLGNEIDGLNSRAIDISVSFSGTRAEFGAAFASVDALGRPNGIVVQSRGTDIQFASCTTTIPLPPSARQISHPALSTSGWLFVSASSDAGPPATGVWKLYARWHSEGRNQCQGWDSDWVDLGHFPDRPVGSAPDAVVVDGYTTLVFVTDRDGYIDFRTNINDLRINPRRSWASWRSLRATGEGHRPQFMAGSKPAAVIYKDGSVVRCHVFWLDTSHRRINHIWGNPGPRLFNEQGNPDSREFRDDVGPTTARTACSAGPEITAPNPLFIVCGNGRNNNQSGYSIAHFRNPTVNLWGDERPSGVVWRRTNAYGGFTAPSLGNPYIGASGSSMFVTFGIQFCPPPTGRPPRPPVTCFRYDQWIIPTRYTPVSGWVSPLRAGTLF